MKLFITIAIIGLLSSCSTFKMAVPTKFAEVATRMPVKGLTGLMIKQKISFGNFQTSIIKRGWTVARTRILNQAFSDYLNIGMQNTVEDTKDKLSYTLTNDNKTADIFCQTNISAQQTNFIKNSKWITTISNLDNFDYTFSATILPGNNMEMEPWQLFYYKTYDDANETNRKILSIPIATEEGTASNGEEEIIIKPIRVDKSVNKKGKATTLLHKVPSGYELKIEDGVVAIINTIDKEIWMYNELDNNTKFIIGCIASSLMLGVTDNE